MTKKAITSSILTKRKKSTGRLKCSGMMANIWSSKTTTMICLSTIGATLKPPDGIGTLASQAVYQMANPVGLSLRHRKRTKTLMNGHQITTTSS